MWWWPEPLCLRIWESAIDSHWLTVLHLMAVLSYRQSTRRFWEIWGRLCAMGISSWCMTGCMTGWSSLCNGGYLSHRLSPPRSWDKSRTGLYYGELSTNDIHFWISSYVCLSSSTRTVFLGIPGSPCGPSGRLHSSCSFCVTTTESSSRDSWMSWSDSLFIFDDYENFQWDTRVTWRIREVFANFGWVMGSDVFAGAGFPSPAVSRQWANNH